VRVVALDHLILTVSDVDHTLAFYERLGMRRETFGEGRTALRFGKQKINLHRAGAEITPHAAQPAPGSADICLLIDEPVEQAALELAAAGLEIELGPVDRTGAQRPIRSLYLRDPDANLVELAH
jgi:catechol 2,3-dioxygenase-like lactoylglutathione lyase family enzyme